MKSLKTSLIFFTSVILIFLGIYIWNKPFKVNAQENNQGKTLQKIQELIQDGQFVMKGNQRREQIKEIFGEPKNIKVKTSGNGKTTEFIYDGLTYILYKDDLREQVGYLSVSSNKYKMKYGLNVSVSKDSVKETLGKPDLIKGNVFNYKYETEVSIDYINFYFENGKLVKIEWIFGMI